MFSLSQTCVKRHAAFTRRRYRAPAATRRGGLITRPAHAYASMLRTDWRRLNKLSPAMPAKPIRPIAHVDGSGTPEASPTTICCDSDPFCGQSPSGISATA